MKRLVVHRSEPLTLDSAYELVDNLSDLHIVYSGNDAAIRITEPGVKLPYVSVETTSPDPNTKALHLVDADRTYLDSPHVSRAVWVGVPEVHPGAKQVPHAGTGIVVETCQGVTITNPYAFGYAIGLAPIFGKRRNDAAWATGGLTLIGGRFYYNSFAGLVVGQASEEHDWTSKGRPVKPWENDGIRELWIEGGTYEGNGVTQMMLSGSRVAGCITGVHLEPSKDNAGTPQPSLWVGHNHPYKNDILDLVAVRAGHVKVVGNASGVLIRKSTLVGTLDTSEATKFPWVEDDD